MDNSSTVDFTMQPKELIQTACLQIADSLNIDGFQLVKSRMSLIKKDSKFRFIVYFQSNKWNRRGAHISTWVRCKILSAKHKSGRTGLPEYYFDMNLGYLANRNYEQWRLDEQHFHESVQEIQSMLNQYFIPIVVEMTSNLPGFVAQVAENGFCPWNRRFPYKINGYFVARYGTKEQLRHAIQKYYYNLNESSKKNFLDLKEDF